LLGASHSLNWGSAAYLGLSLQGLHLAYDFVEPQRLANHPSKDGGKN
jgi:hypothetical protein